LFSIKSVLPQNPQQTRFFLSLLKESKMMKEVAFTPGRFSPVVEVSQRESGLPAPAETDFSGLEEVAKSTLLVANAANRGTGAVLPEPVPVDTAAKIIGYVLALRNIVEQLLFVGVHTRLTTPLRAASLSPLEPLVRAYNYYGHFELNGKHYVARGLETEFINYLFSLVTVATLDNANGTRWTHNGSLTDIDLDLYHLNSSGEIAFGKQMPLKEYLVTLVKDISNMTTEVDVQIPTIRDILQVTTEGALNVLLRQLRMSFPSWTAPPRDTVPDATDAHKKAMKKIFDKEYSSAGDVIPVSKFTSAITNGYNFLRRISIERSYAMKTMPIPKYEGGSLSQLARYTDDVLYSDVSLPLDASTAAIAFTQAYGSTSAFKSAPGHEREELLRELVSQSLLPTRR
jgi:hypothetical protein